MFIDNNAIEVISNLPYITYLLQQVHGTRNGLTIISASHRFSYASSILEVNEVDNSLLIDALSQGQTIPDDITEFTIMLEKVRTWFIVDNFTQEIMGGDVFYRTSFPKSLYRVQRRNHYRVAVPMAFNSRIKATVADDSRTIIGVISDISLGGIGFTVPSDARKLFEPHSVIRGVFIELGGLCSITADLEVRHVVHTNKTQSTFVGSQFCKLDSSKSQKIAWAVQELQRIELRDRKR
jgi:flagellar brake protein